MVDRELRSSSPLLAAKPRLVVASKCEDESARARAAELAGELGRPVLCISSHQGRGLDELLRSARELVRAAAAEAGPQAGSPQPLGASPDEAQGPRGGAPK